MANLTRQKSRQDFELWVDSAGSKRNTKHSDIRVKARNNDVEVEVGFQNGEYSTFKTSFKKLQKFGKVAELKKYIIKIKPLLELHWESKMDDGDFINAAVFIKQGDDILTAVDKAITMWV